MFKVLKNRNFFLLFQGAFVSEIGNMLYNTAMMLWVLEETGSELQMSIFMAIAVFTRVIMSPIAGVLVDRWNRIKIIYMTDFIRAILFVILAYVFFIDMDFSITIIILYIITILSSVNAAFFFPAVGSSIPDIVGENNLQAAQGLQGFLMQLPAIMGLALGASLYDTSSIELITLLNAITFGLSGLSEMFIKATQHHEEEDRDYSFKRIFTDYGTSLSYIKNNGLLALVLFFLMLNFSVIPIVSIAPPALFKSILQRENTMEYAATGIAFGVSSMFASLVIGSLKIKNYSTFIPRSIIGLSSFFGVMALLFHLVSTGQLSYWPFYLLYLGLTIFMAFNVFAVNIPVNVGITLSIEPKMRGRVFSTIGALSQLGVPFAMLIGGFVLEFYSISILGLVCVILVSIPTIGFTLNGKVKTLLANLDEKRAKLALEEATLTE